MPQTAAEMVGTPVHLLVPGVLDRRTDLNNGGHVYAGSPDNWIDPDAVQVCRSTTKKGDPCKARPTASGLCVGHARAARTTAE
jgi:hypothetical protein